MRGQVELALFQVWRNKKPTLISSKKKDLMNKMEKLNDFNKTIQNKNDNLLVQLSNFKRKMKLNHQILS